MRPVKPHIRVEFRRNGLWYENGGGGVLLPFEEPALEEAEELSTHRWSFATCSASLLRTEESRRSTSTALNVTASGRPSARRSFPMRLNSKCLAGKRSFKMKKKKNSMERFFFLFFFTRRPKKGQSRKKKKVEQSRFSSSSRTRIRGKRGGTVPEKLSNLAVKYNDVVFVSHRDSWYVYSSGSL